MTEFLITSKERSVMYQLLASFYLHTPNVPKIKLEYEMLLNAKEIFTEVNFDSLIEEAMFRLNKVNENADYIEQIKLQYYDHIFTQISPYYIPPYESSVIGAKKSKVTRKNKGGWDYNKAPGATLYNVELAYKTVGFAPSKLNVSEELKNTKKTDHLGFELAFMAFLNEQEEESEENINWYKLQTLFLNDHLNNFIKKYNEISLDKSKGFYSSLSNVTDSFIRWDLSLGERGEVIGR